MKRITDAERAALRTFNPSGSPQRATGTRQEKMFHVLADKGLLSRDGGRKRSGVSFSLTCKGRLAAELQGVGN